MTNIGVEACLMLNRDECQRFTNHGATAARGMSEFMAGTFQVAG